MIYRDFQGLKLSALGFGAMRLPADKLPSACLQCRSFEQVCPQQIKISEVLADFSQKLG